MFQRQFVINQWDPSSFFLFFFLLELTVGCAFAKTVGADAKKRPTGPARQFIILRAMLGSRKDQRAVMDANSRWLQCLVFPSQPTERFLDQACSPFPSLVTAESIANHAHTKLQKQNWDGR